MVDGGFIHSLIVPGQTTQTVLIGMTSTFGEDLTHLWLQKHESYFFRVTINQISVTGLSISVLFLLIASSIFSLCSSLWCGRVRIHNNLCVSLLASNLSWVVWHYAVLAEHQELFYKCDLSCDTFNSGLVSKQCVVSGHPRGHYLLHYDQLRLDAL